VPLFYVNTKKEQTMRDLETRKRFRSIPPCTEIVSNSKRGDTFLKDWIDSNDKPARDKDGRLFLILVDSDAGRCLVDADHAGLVF
jgi:hypothetical protein